MKNTKKFILVFLIAIFLLSFISCKSTPQRLDRIEKGYSKEFREHLESLGDEKYLTELLKSSEKIELLYEDYHTRELRLIEIKEKYPIGFGDYLEQNSGERLEEIIYDKELVDLLGYLFEWYGTKRVDNLVNSSFSNDEIKAIISTVKDMNDDGTYSTVYLDYIENKTINYYNPQYSLEENSSLFITLYDYSYPVDDMFILFNKFKEEEYSYDDAIGYCYYVAITIPKLNDLKAKYSTDFISKLEALDIELQIKIIDDEEAIDAEYNRYFQNLIELTESFFEDRVIFNIDKDTYLEIFGDYYEEYFKHISDRNLTRAEKIVKSAINKYPIGFLPNHIEKIYVLKDGIGAMRRTMEGNIFFLGNK